MTDPQITRTPIDSVNWTSIVAPVACDYVAFYAEGGAAISIRSMKTDPSTQKALAADIQETVATPPTRSRRDTRYVAGDVVGYVQAAAGTDTVVATWSGILGS